MNTSVTSNWRLLSRVLYLFLIAVATLWAMPRNARAQLYVSQGQEFNSVAEYDVNTGVLMTPTLISRFGAAGLALSGDNLFVMFAAGDGYINQYNATTGAMTSLPTIHFVGSGTNLALGHNMLFATEV